MKQLFLDSTSASPPVLPVLSEIEGPVLLCPEFIEGSEIEGPVLLCPEFIEGSEIEGPVLLWLEFIEGSEIEGPVLSKAEGSSVEGVASSEWLGGN